MNKKNILMVAYYFPPFGGVPVQRTLKFVKYLLKHGWNPVVLTVRNGYDHFNLNDKSLIKKIPDKVEVIRTREIGVVARVVMFLNRNIQKGAKQPDKTDRFAGKILNLRKLLYNSFWFPDEKNSWIPCTFFKGLRILAKEDISVIYVSGYPWSAFLIGAYLSILSGTPLILDFRDAWTLNPRKLWDNRFHGFWEGLVLRHASKAIFATNKMRENYIDRYQWINKEKFITITNGYDADDYKLYEGKKKENNRFIITFTGTFNDNVPPRDIDQSPYYFLQGLSRLLNENDISGKILVRFIGNIGNNNKILVKEMNLQDVVEFTGHIPHDDCIKYQMESDVLLLIIYTCEWSKFVLTGKLFEYIGARKFILALVPDGEAKNLITNDGFGKVVKPTDIDGIKNAILESYNEWRQGGLQLKIDNSVFKKYEMNTLTDKLVEALDEVIHK